MNAATPRALLALALGAIGPAGAERNGENRDDPAEVRGLVARCEVCCGEQERAEDDSEGNGDAKREAFA